MRWHRPGKETRSASRRPAHPGSLTCTGMRPCRLASGRPAGDKFAGQQPEREAVCFTVRDVRLCSSWHSLGAATKMARRLRGRRRHLGRRRSQPQSVPSPTSATSPAHHPPRVSQSTIADRWSAAATCSSAISRAGRAIRSAPSSGTPSPSTSRTSACRVRRRARLSGLTKRGRSSAQSTRTVGVRSCGTLPPGR